MFGMISAAERSHYIYKYFDRKTRRVANTISTVQSIISNMTCFCELILAFISSTLLTKLHACYTTHTHPTKSPYWPHSYRYVQYNKILLCREVQFLSRNFLGPVCGNRNFPKLSSVVLLCVRKYVKTHEMAQHCACNTLGSSKLADQHITIKFPTRLI